MSRKIEISADHARALVTAAARHYMAERRRQARRKTLQKDAACWAMEMADLKIAIETTSKIAKAGR